MKKVLPALFLALFLTGINQAALACSCIFVSDYFCPSVRVNTEIVVGRVLNNYVAGPNQAPLMDIEVIEWLKTEDPSPDTISVLGQDGLNCNESLSYFSAGDSVVLAVFGYGGGWHPVDISPHRIYNLSGCGRFFLFFSEGNIVGPIRENVSSEPYEVFKSGLEACILLTATEETPEASAQVNIFPNPATHLLNIDTRDLPGSPQVVFMNTFGQILSLKTWKANNQAVISADISTLAPGMYFVVLEYGDRRRAVKWIKS